MQRILVVPSRMLVLVVSAGLALGCSSKCTDCGADSSTAGTDADTSSGDPSDSSGAGETDGGSGQGACTPAGDLSVQPLAADAPTGFDAAFSKQVDVWGLTIFATPATPDDKVVHAANVFAEYLDNDENCEVDDAAVHDALLARDASLVMFATEAEAEALIDALFDAVPPPVIDNMALQDLYGSETHPNGAAEGLFDASLEEVLHLVSSAGWSEAYPSAFGIDPGTLTTNAMDIARGGYFETVPASYPQEAWYHYDDVTCDYGCMAVEYFYWALTSHLGGQDFADRCEEIAVEWEPCTASQFAATDVAMHALLTDAAYALPTVLPDGSYEAQGQ
jgi:hypothetical protein